MLYNDDIALDLTGNSIVKNGEFAITNSDVGFITRMLLDREGSWKMWPSLGVGLDEFVGRIIDEDLLRQMRIRIRNFFTQFGLLPFIDIYALDRERVACDMEFRDQNETMQFRMMFNVQSGKITLVYGSYDSIHQQQANVTNNKYMARIK